MIGLYIEKQRVGCVHVRIESLFAHRSCDCKVSHYINYSACCLATTRIQVHWGAKNLVLLECKRCADDFRSRAIKYTGTYDDRPQNVEGRDRLYHLIV